MSDYVIGDVQGCYEPLQRLLELIHFDEKIDKLYFVGDLVNRGPDSLAVLRFLHALPIPPIITLGNHDLHLLASLFGSKPWIKALKGEDESLQKVLQSEDGEELGHWLRMHPLLFHHADLKVVLSHAGIAPMWDLGQAKKRAQEVEVQLSGDGYREVLMHLYGNKPDIWSEELTGYARLRVIISYFTRMRYCDQQGRLEFHYKGPVDKAPKHLYPWYVVPLRREIEAEIIFGHWASLQGINPSPKIHAIDTGCLWGGHLTALRLQDRQRFSVPGLIRSA